MTWWNVSTQEKKNVFEHELYQKDDWVIRRITGFRWGTVLIETEDDNPPVLNQTDGPGADAVDMYNTEYNYELNTLSDGWFEDIIFPDDMPEEERDRLMSLIDELDIYEALEIEEGWSQYETECWFHGPLDIEQSDWEEPGSDEWERAEITPELQDHFQRALGNLDDEITFNELAKINPANEEANQPHPSWPFPTGNPTKGE